MMTWVAVVPSFSLSSMPFGPYPLVGDEAGFQEADDVRGDLRGQDGPACLEGGPEQREALVERLLAEVLCEQVRGVDQAVHLDQLNALVADLALHPELADS